MKIAIEDIGQIQLPCKVIIVGEERPAYQSLVVTDTLKLENELKLILSKGFYAEVHNVVKGKSKAYRICNSFTSEFAIEAFKINDTSFVKQNKDKRRKNKSFSIARGFVSEVKVNLYNELYTVSKGLKKSKKEYLFNHRDTLIGRAIICQYLQYTDGYSSFKFKGFVALNT